MKANLDKLWKAFPDHAAYPTLKDLYTWLGGKAPANINAPGFGPNGNTCASRLSVAFNHGGAPIGKAAATLAGARTITAGDGSIIIYRVAEFRKFLLSTLGKPSVDNVSPYDDKFVGKKGIIAFTVNWIDASGHIALWNGTGYREAHDNYATFVGPGHPSVRTSLGEFWELR